MLQFSIQQDAIETIAFLKQKHEIVRSMAYSLVSLTMLRDTVIKQTDIAAF